MKVYWTHIYELLSSTTDLSIISLTSRRKYNLGKKYFLQISWCCSKMVVFPKTNCSNCNERIDGVDSTTPMMAEDLVKFFSFDTLESILLHTLIEAQGQKLNSFVEDWKKDWRNTERTEDIMYKEYDEIITLLNRELASWMEEFSYDNENVLAEGQL